MDSASSAKAIGYATGMDPNPYKSPERADLAPPRIPERVDGEHTGIGYRSAQQHCQN